MGAVLAKFRKEKTTTVVLEGLEEKIQQIEKYSLNTQEQKKRFVGNFLAISIGVYVIAFLVFYFVYFPPTWSQRIIYSVPLFLFPFVIILLRKLFTWYFQRKLNKNTTKLTALRAEKKKILEQVMDKETYKVAVALLARFGDKNTGAVKPVYAMTPRPSTTSMNQSLRTNNNKLNATLNPQQQQRSLNNTLPHSPRPLGAISSQHQPTSTALTPHRSGLGAGGGSIVGQELRRRTPFPIINAQEKGVFERIVDALIGDGPNDRFAMICKECFGHNGMAQKEEFDYATFRCAFCNAINHARKARPVAPRLPIQSPRLDVQKDSDSSSSSDEDSDKETRHQASNFNMNATSPIERTMAEAASPSYSPLFGGNAARTEATAKKSSSSSSVGSSRSQTETTQALSSNMKSNAGAMEAEAEVADKHQEESEKMEIENTE